MPSSSSRPAFALEVDRSTPPLPIWRNNILAAESLPSGAHVLYPPEPGIPLMALRKQIEHAIENPVDGDALSARLRANMKLTIAFDDLSATDQALPSPDPRSIALETALTAAANAQVDDVQIVSARGLSRRMHKPEMYRLTGERITDSFVVTNLLTQHDADDEDNLQSIGSGIEINKRVAESDLLIYITINQNYSDAYRNIATRLTSATTAIAAGKSANTDDMGKQIESTTPIFQIALNLNNDHFKAPLGFLQKRINEWSPVDKVAFKASKSVLDVAPYALLNRFAELPPSNQGVIAVNAGSVSATHSAARKIAANQNGIKDVEPSDVLVLGNPPTSQYSINSVLNPVLAAHQALTTAVPLDGSTPLIRKGGTLIIHQDPRTTFDSARQPSFLDFFNQSLPVDDETFAKQQEAFANDAWYTHLYRTSYAHHGLLPYFLWNQCEAARNHIGEIISVGCETNTAHRLGFRRASTFEDAIEMARDNSGINQPSIAHLPFPYPRAVS